MRISVNITTIDGSCCSHSYELNDATIESLVDNTHDAIEGKRSLLTMANPTVIYRAATIVRIEYIPIDETPTQRTPGLAEAFVRAMAKRAD